MRIDLVRRMQPRALLCGSQVLFAQLMDVLRQSHAEQCTECLPAKPGDFFKGPVCSSFMQVGVCNSCHSLADCASIVTVSKVLALSLQWCISACCSFCMSTRISVYLVGFAGVHGRHRPDGATAAPLAGVRGRACTASAGRQTASPASATAVTATADTATAVWTRAADDTA